MTYISTVPGFSSRSSDHIVKQFPHRDEAAMSQHDPEPGFSNSDPADHAPDSVYPEVEAPEELVPGFSNGKAVKSDEPAAETKVVDDAEAEDKSVKPAAKKAPAKKRG